MAGGGSGVSVRAFDQGDRQAWPERWFPAVFSRQDDHGRIDPSDVVTAGVVAQANPSFTTLTHKGTQHAYVGGRRGLVDVAGGTAAGAEPALRVVVIYQDPLTRHWATELWGRVGKLIDRGGIGSRSWKLSELSRGCIFADAVEAAAEADVLVISVRDTGELPPLLRAWVDRWVTRRAGRTGALVALIGVPAGPHAVFGRTCEYLEAVAHQAGLDFLPRERKLPEEPQARSTLPRMAPAIDLTASWFETGPSPSTGVSLGWGLAE